jgi:hypothetical protein
MAVPVSTCDAFWAGQTVIFRHVGNIFKEGKLARESNMQKMHIAGSDKPVAFYNLFNSLEFEGIKNEAGRIRLL